MKSSRQFSLKWILLLFSLILIAAIFFKPGDTPVPEKSQPIAEERKSAVEQLNSGTIKVDPRHLHPQPLNASRSDSGQTLEDSSGQTATTQGASTATDIASQKLQSSTQRATGSNAGSEQTSQAPLPVTMGFDLSKSKEKAQQLVAAAAQGDMNAMKTLEDLNTALRQAIYNDPRSMKQPGETDSRERDAFVADNFKPIHDAIDALSEEASKGNQNALDALAHAAQTRGLQGFAMDAIGKLAGDGNQSALDALTHPSQYGLLLSSTVGALKTVADKGNQQAIDALIAITTNPKNQPLWFNAANGLGQAAGSGNDAAISALIPLGSSENQSIRNAALAGLQLAAKNQNQKAREALRTLDPKGGW